MRALRINARWSAAVLTLSLENGLNMETAAPGSGRPVALAPQTGFYFLSSGARSPSADVLITDVGAPSAIGAFGSRCSSGFGYSSSLGSGFGATEGAVGEAGAGAGAGASKTGASKSSEAKSCQ